MTDQDLHYLQSILNQLREMQSMVGHAPSLGSEVMADNTNWLDCFIDKHRRALEPKP